MKLWVKTTTAASVLPKQGGGDNPPNAENLTSSNLTDAYQNFKTSLLGDAIDKLLTFLGGALFVYGLAKGADAFRKSKGGDGVLKSVLSAALFPAAGALFLVQEHWLIFAVDTVVWFVILLIKSVTSIVTTGAGTT